MIIIGGEQLALGRLTLSRNEQWVKPMAAESRADK